MRKITKIHGREVTHALINLFNSLRERWLTMLPIRGNQVPNTLTSDRSLILFLLRKIACRIIAHSSRQF